MTTVYIILAVVLLLIIIGFAVFRKAIVRRRRPSLQGVDRPAFVREHPDVHRLVEAGRQWYHSHDWQRVDTVSFDGLGLAGFLLEHENARGTVLLMHGYRSDGISDFSCAFDFYYAQGFNLLLINERAHGESEGRYICFGVKERFDCLSWCKWLENRFGEDSDVFLSGVSMGATVVQMASALEMPECVRGVISDCGFSSPWDEIRHVMWDMAHIPTFPLIWILEAYCRLFAGFSLREFSTLTALKQTRLPFLFVHGQADGFVPCCMTEAGYAACASEKELILVPGAGHGLAYPTDTPRCRAALLEFFRKYSGDRQHMSQA